VTIDPFHVEVVAQRFRDETGWRLRAGPDHRRAAARTPPAGRYAQDPRRADS
jgi:hypothetical protein